MAVPPNTNTAFLREVDDEVRRERAMAFLRRWGVWIAGGVVVVLLALGAFLLWQHHQDAQAAAAGEALDDAYQSLATSKFADSARQLAPIANSPVDGARAMARFTQGDLQLQDKKLKEAAATFASIAGDTGLAQPFRDLALIRQTSAEYDGLKPQQVVDRLRGLAVKGNAYFGSAGELVAVAYLRMGRTDLAQQLYSQMASDDAMPDTLRQRAVQMAGATALGAPVTAKEQKTK